jgi:nicotinate-nucleotide adenylyltransferase
LARLGILGGTFNPPHVGHLLMAQEAHAQLGLDVVILMPVAAPPHKEIDDDPGPEARYELCRAAVAKDDRFRVSRLEIDRGGASYTADTLREIHAAHPEDELTFIVGGDQAQGLPRWREPEAILEMATLAVAERDGIARNEITETLAPLRGSERTVFFDMPRVDVSSSDVRRRVRETRPIRYLVPDDVVRLIGARGYYRPKVSA